MARDGQRYPAPANANGTGRTRRSKRTPPRASAGDPGGAEPASGREPAGELGLRGGAERAGTLADGPGGAGHDGSTASSASAGQAGGSAGAEEAARLICLRLLTAAPRTRAQLADALRRHRVPDEIAESLLRRFADVGLIDDAAFARAWVESRHHGRGLARRMLAAELRQRGVAAEEVRAAVGSVGPEEEVATARGLVAKRIAATRGRPLPARVRHLVGVLARRGYPAGLAYRVVAEALEQEGTGAYGTGLYAEDFGEDEAPEVCGAGDSTPADEWANG